MPPFPRIQAARFDGLRANVPEDDCQILWQELQPAVFKEPLIYNQKRGVDAWHQRCDREHRISDQGLPAHMGGRS